MVQIELSYLRTKVKAMQDTMDALSAQNKQLLAEQAMGASKINAGLLTVVIFLFCALIPRIQSYPFIVVVWHIIAAILK